MTLYPLDFAEMVENLREDLSPKKRKGLILIRDCVPTVLETNSPHKDLLPIFGTARAPLLLFVLLLLLFWCGVNRNGGGSDRSFRGKRLGGSWVFCT